MSPDVRITVREQRRHDIGRVSAVLTEAFGATAPEHGRHVADLADDLLAGPSRLALVAEVDHEIVGHLQLSRCWLDAPPCIVEVLVLSPLGVAPEHRNVGVGGALVRGALAWAESVGSPLVFLEGEPAYYPRFGFHQAGRHGFRPPSDRIPDAAFQVAILPAWEPWMTGALVYCDTFWRHDAVGLRRSGD